MRAVTSEVVAAILAVSIPAIAMAQGPLEAPMVAIKGDSYPIGSADGPVSTRLPHRVTLDPFLIDVYEVTNAQFAAFLNTLEVTARRDVRAGELRPDDVNGPDADPLRGGSSGNDRAFLEMDDTDARRVEGPDMPSGTSARTCGTLISRPFLPRPLGAQPRDLLL